MYEISKRKKKERDGRDRPPQSHSEARTRDTKKAKLWFLWTSLETKSWQSRPLPQEESPKLRYPVLRPHCQRSIRKVVLR
jgi:hypothetical protein